MNEPINAYLKKLEKLSNAELDHGARELVGAERRHVAGVIAHLCEISRRKAHLERGYKDLFDYGVRALGLSEGSVWRRLQVAKVANDFPCFLEALYRSEISLTAASLLAPHLCAENVKELLADCAGKSKREIEAYLAGRWPKAEFQPSVRKLGKKGKKSASGQAPAASQEPTEAPGFLESEPVREPRPILRPASDDRFLFRFSGGKKLKDKLERFAEVVGVECPQQNLEILIENALDLALEKKDPERKLERRRKRERAREAKILACPGEPVRTNGESKKNGERGERTATSRYIPSSVRERVLERAGYRCEFHSPDGRRCTQRTALEIDHQRSFSKHLDHDERYLRALCQGHNLYSAEEEFGVEFVRGKIEARGKKRGAG